MKPETEIKTEFSEEEVMNAMKTCFKNMYTDACHSCPFYHRPEHDCHTVLVNALENLFDKKNDSLKNLKTENETLKEALIEASEQTNESISTILKDFSLKLEHSLSLFFSSSVNMENVMKTTDKTVSEFLTNL